MCGMKDCVKVQSRSLADRIIDLVETARQKTVSAVNLAMVYTYFEIGRQIVLEEQGGAARAGYGDRLLIDLSSRLTKRFGCGYSVDNLQNMRKFYLAYSVIDIYEKPSRKSKDRKYEIDLKRGDLKHQDLGQMQMYVNYFDREEKLPEENPTIGIVLCHDKSDALVELTLPRGNDQIFAKQYRTVLPSKKQLKALIEAQLQ